METWAEIEAAVRRRAADYDPGRLATADAEALVRRLGRISATVFTVQSQAAARAAEGGRWRSAGARTPAEHLARQVGVGIGDARRLLDTGERLESLPEVRQAAVAGELSAPALALVADAAVVAPTEAPRLLEKAKDTTLGDLRDICLKTKAAADPDPAATHARIHAARRFRSWTDAEGAGCFSGRGAPEDLAWLRSVIATTREDLFGTARRSGEVVPSEQLDYDAFFATLRGAVGEEPGDSGLPPSVRTAELGTLDGAGSDASAHARSDAAGTGRLPTRANRRSHRTWSRATVIVRVDAAAAERGHPIPGERCEIAGVGPVPVGTVQTMLGEGASLAVVSSRVETDANGEPCETVERVAHVRADRATEVDIRDPAAVRTVLERTGRRVAGLVHAGRHAPAHIDTALRWLNPVCTVEGCLDPRCDIDHRTGWAITQATRLDDLDPLCRFHHNLKTHHGWALVDGSGERPIVAPEDPRHPRHRRAG